MEGVLQVQGTGASPVYFTSLHDDSVGGNTDNASVSPAPGDWYGIAVQGAGQAVLSHAVNHYAGWGGSALFFAGSSLQMADSEVAFSADKGLQVQKKDSASVIVSNSIFEENEGYAVSARSLDPTLDGIEFSGNQGANNGLNAIFLDGTLSTMELKANAELPYVFQSLVVGAGQTVTVKPGAVFKAMPRDPGSLGLFSVAGSLQVAGSDADPVYFTSVHDDSVGGDTDGSSTPPLPGDWAGILVQQGGEVGLSFGSVAYAGMNDAALYNFGRLEIGNSLVSYGAHHGIVNGPGGELVLEDSIVRNNAQTGIKNAGTGFLARNDIMNNLEYGVYSNTQGYILVAEHNYWGSAGGPAWDGIQNCDPLPQGGGDKVSCATVDYRPFSAVPYH